MVEDTLRYDRMVERALRGVVREALEVVGAEGLPGDHHFYLTFTTEHAGVDIPDYLRKQYPDEMTIVLQYQFYDLTMDDEGFAVTLSFNNRRERLSVPFAAVTTFADPSVNFALQFQMQESALDAEAGEPEAEPEGDAPEPDPETTGDGEKGKIVTLDSFRKK